MKKEETAFAFSVYEVVREDVGIVIDLNTWKRFCMRQVKKMLTSGQTITGYFFSFPGRPLLSTLVKKTPELK